MFERILVPLDGSLLAENALEHAGELAQKFQSKLFLLQVLTPDLGQTMSGIGLPVEMDPASAGLTEQRLEEEERSSNAYLGQVVSRLVALGISAQASEVFGDPVDAILDEVKAKDATLVVMSTHGRSGLARVVFGSVAQKVLHACPVPVLVIRAQPAS